jgi:uncharacterized SAM-binding protein YcdF (DUF218 family)
MPKIRLKKVFKWGLIVLAAVFLLDALIIVFFANFRPSIKQADAIVVLGAAINTPALYNRSLKGLQLYEQGKAPLLILSGGRISPKFISEATYMQRAMQSKAVLPLNIILEEDSHNTYENIVYSKNKSPNTNSLIIVSDKFHLARASLIALRNGFFPVYWDSPNPVYYSKKELLFYYFREAFAMLAYMPKFLFN